MLQECHNCGAPLDVASGTDVVKCNYCGQAAKTEKNKTVAFQTPPDWKPPERWKPPAESPLGDIELVYKPAIKAVGALVRGVVLTGILVSGIGGFIAWKVQSTMNQASTSVLSQFTQSGEVQSAALSALEAAGKAALSAADTARKARQLSGAGAGKLPVLCSGNDNLTFEATSFALPAGVPILASENCTITLRNCTVSGTTAITVKNNAKVNVDGGSYTGKGPAILVADNGEFHASGGAVVTGEPGVMSSGNAHVTLRGASVSGKRAAVMSSGNADVDTDGAAIDGPVVGKHAKKK